MPAPRARAESPRSGSPSALEHEHESFFAAGEKADRAHREGEGGLVEAHDDHEDDRRALAKMTPAVRERRARFTRYVTWAVGASAVLCLAAVIRVLVARGQHEPDIVSTPVPSASSLAPSPAPSAPARSPTAGFAAPSAVFPAQVPTSAPLSDATSAAAPAAATASAPAASAAIPKDEMQPDPVRAKEAKKAAQLALEHNKLDAAIEAGERAVALDPTDGDAWLLLGAAYNERGKAADARRAFVSCVKQGKRGAVRECAAMLRL